jgi:hypothetical protein
MPHHQTHLSVTGADHPQKRRKRDVAISLLAKDAEKNKKNAVNNHLLIYLQNMTKNDNILDNLIQS